MRKQLLLGAAATAIGFACYAYVQPSSAGWGAPFVPGTGAQTNKINWDYATETPSEKPVQVVTGISAKDAKATAETDKEFSVDELKAGKPFLVYYFVAQKAGAKPDCNDPNYSFAQKAEFSAFGGKDTIDRINAGWVPKKVEIDADADHKDEKNQARIEFWSFTQKKLDVINLKGRSQLSGSAFDTRLKQLESKNRDICSAEIKRINDENERRKKEEESKTTASK